MNGISLTASMRSNLLSLQNISGQVSSTQNKLATGNKINSAIDNPGSYYTARSLNNRADDLNALLDSMGQAISTIKAATEGIESATELLEQMRAVTEQTLTEAELKPISNCSKLEDNSAELIAQGYTAITADMSLAEIQAILDTDNAKVVLTEDITLNSLILVHGKNVIINGGGHTFTSYGIVNYSSGATIENLKINNTVNSTNYWARAIIDYGGNITIRNLAITHNNTFGQVSALELRGNSVVENVDISLSGSADQMCGVYVGGTSSVSNVSVTLSGASNSIMAAIGTQSENVTISNVGVSAGGGRAYGVIGSIKGLEAKPVGGTLSKPAALYDGKENTQAIVGELGQDALAAYATTQFYVGNKSGEFGQNSWYLPSIGELMNTYGINTDEMNASWGNNSGATGDNKKSINDTLTELEKHGIAKKMTDGYYWSSSEMLGNSSWGLSFSNGRRSHDWKQGTYYVRAFNEVKNVFSQNGNRPQVGDIMYEDKTWGSAADYDGSKTAVGVVTEIGDDGSVKIMSLKDLTFSSQNTAGSFNPDNPYGESSSTTFWSTKAKANQDVVGVENYTDFKLLFTLNPSAPVVSVDDLNAAFAKPNTEDFQLQYNEILSQYDTLIKDSSYKGVNLLNGGSLNVKFNEDNSASLNVQGKDISSGSIGLTLADWTEKEGILQSVQELSGTIAALRSYTSELGNNYNIITTRQDFTESLINVLTEGADKLTLADMNEESANMLALQTRQQLAINSLSLASQASQSILKLF